MSTRPDGKPWPDRCANVHPVNGRMAPERMMPDICAVPDETPPRKTIASPQNIRTEETKMPYTKQQLVPLWLAVFMETDGNIGDFNGSMKANIIVTLMNLYAAHRKWPSVSELRAGLLRMDAAARSLPNKAWCIYQKRLVEMTSSGDVIATDKGTTEKSNIIVAITPYRISIINDILDRNGIPKLDT